MRTLFVPRVVGTIAVCPLFYRGRQYKASLVVSGSQVCYQLTPRKLVVRRIPSQLVLCFLLHGRYPHYLLTDESNRQEEKPSLSR